MTADSPANKIMLLGEIGVGKSSIVGRLVFDRLDGFYGPTIGVDVYNYDLENPGGGRPRRLIVWYTDGNYGDAIFNHVYMRQASAALVVADLSRPQTLETLQRLAETMLTHQPGRYCGLVLNKTDLLPTGARAELPSCVWERPLPVRAARPAPGEKGRRAFQDAAEAMARRGR